MDTKYFVYRNPEGRIEWVGVDTDNAFKTYKITNTEDEKVYNNLISQINERTNGEFQKALINKEVAEVGEPFFTGHTKEKIKKVKPAEETLRRKLFAARLVAIGASTILIASSLTSLAFSEKTQARVGKLFGKGEKKVEQSIDETTEETEEAQATLNLEGKSVEELIDMLDDEEQREAFRKIIEAQDYFNQEAAPTVAQGDKQLFVRFDEVVAAYLYANAGSMSSEKLANYFGKSKIMLLNEETGEYEEMNKDLVSAKYLSFCNVLSYYYQLGATERSGVDGLFENEKEAKFFRDFEDLVLEYNRTHSDAVKAKIEERLLEIYLSGNVDSLSDKYQGASSIIATAMVPDLYLNKVIDKKTYEAIVEKMKPLLVKKSTVKSKK